MEKKYRIGYIDEDDKQVKLFRRELRDYGFEIIGYQFKKGMILNDLMKQVYKSNVDLVMIDYKLKGTKVTFNGEKVESDLYEKKPRFPYIIFTSKRGDAEDFVEDWKMIFDKSEITAKDKPRQERFVKMLTKSIEQYQNFIVKKKIEISDLLLKGESKGLNAVEKDTLLKLQRELQDLDKTIIQEVPEQLISIQKLEDLSSTRKEAEEFLQSLIEKNRRQ